MYIHYSSCRTACHNLALASLPHFFHQALWCTLESCSFCKECLLSLPYFSSLAHTQKQQAAITDFELLLYVRAATPTLPLTHECLLQGCRNPRSFAVEPVQNTKLDGSPATPVTILFAPRMFRPLTMNKGILFGFVSQYSSVSFVKVSHVETTNPSRIALTLIPLIFLTSLLLVKPQGLFCYGLVHCFIGICQWRCNRSTLLSKVFSAMVLSIVSLAFASGDATAVPWCQRDIFMWVSICRQLLLSRSSCPRRIFPQYISTDTPLGATPVVPWYIPSTTKCM